MTSSSSLGSPNACPSMPSLCLRLASADHMSIGSLKATCLYIGGHLSHLSPNSCRAAPLCRLIWSDDLGLSEIILMGLSFGYGTHIGPITGSECGNQYQLSFGPDLVKVIFYLSFPDAVFIWVYLKC